MSIPLVLSAFHPSVRSWKRKKSCVGKTFRERSSSAGLGDACQERRLPTGVVTAAPVSPPVSPPYSHSMASFWKQIETWSVSLIRNVRLSEYTLHRVHSANNAPATTNKTHPALRREPWKNSDIPSLPFLGTKCGSQIRRFTIPFVQTRSKRRLHGVARGALPEATKSMCRATGWPSADTQCSSLVQGTPCTFIIGWHL